jgi:hypothetical protein
MEFFVCTCPATGNVILDSYDQGPNRDQNGALVPKLCHSGLHIIALQCSAGKPCPSPKVTVIIENTDQCSPLCLSFNCVDCPDQQSRHTHH